MQELVMVLFLIAVRLNVRVLEVGDIVHEFRLVAFDQAVCAVLRVFCILA